jgi:hypothetical protein
LPSATARTRRACRPNGLARLRGGRSGTRRRWWQLGERSPTARGQSDRLVRFHATRLRDVRRGRGAAGKASCAADRAPVPALAGRSRAPNVARTSWCVTFAGHKRCGGFGRRRGFVLQTFLCVTCADIRGLGRTSADGFPSLHAPLRSRAADSHGQWRTSADIGGRLADVKRLGGIARLAHGPRLERTCGFVSHIVPHELLYRPAASLARRERQRRAARPPLYLRSACASVMTNAHGPHWAVSKMRFPFLFCVAASCARRATGAQSRTCAPPGRPRSLPPFRRTWPRL